MPDPVPEDDLPQPPPPPPDAPARPPETVTLAVYLAWLGQMAIWSAQRADYADDVMQHSLLLNEWIINERRRLVPGFTG